MVSTPWMLRALLGPAWAGSVSGQVVSSPEGEPLAGITVVAWDPRLSYHATVTEEDGSFLVSDLEAGNWRIQALVPDDLNRVDRFYPDATTYCDGSRIAVGADDAIDGVDLALPAGGALTGRLLDADGEPVADADLRAEGADSTVEGLERDASTDADGRFSILGLAGDPGEETAWRCRVRADGIPTQYLGTTYSDDDAETFGATPDEETDLGDQTLLPGIRVEGTVTGPDGPVAGASVHVYATSQVVTTVTGADGSYVATGIPPGEVLPWASASGLATTYYPDADRPGDTMPALEEGDVLTGADLVLPPEATFHATLEGTGGVDEDLSGVTALLYNDTRTVGFGARVSEDGALTIDGLHGGTYTLYLFAGDEGYADDFVRDDALDPLTYTVVAETDNDTVTVVLPVQGSLSGTLVDETGAPVYGGTIIAQSTDDPELSQHAASSDRDGVYLMDSLPAGRWTIEARYGAYCSSDASYVPVWWPESVVNEALAGSLTLGDAEDKSGVDFVLPRDGDQDGMGDTWEASYDLDPTADDSADDPDGDGYTNLEEYLLGTDPTEDTAGGEKGSCACGGGSAAGRLWGLGLGLLSLRRRRRP